MNWFDGGMSKHHHSHGVGAHSPEHGRVLRLCGALHRAGSRSLSLSSWPAGQLPWHTTRATTLLVMMARSNNNNQGARELVSANRTRPLALPPAPKIVYHDVAGRALQSKAVIRDAGLELARDSLHRGGDCLLIMAAASAGQWLPPWPKARQRVCFAFAAELLPLASSGTRNFAMVISFKHVESKTSRDGPGPSVIHMTAGGPLVTNGRIGTAPFSPRRPGIPGRLKRRARQPQRRRWAGQGGEGNLSGLGSLEGKSPPVREGAWRTIGRVEARPRFWRGTVTVSILCTMAKARGSRPRRDVSSWEGHQVRRRRRARRSGA